MLYVGCFRLCVGCLLFVLGYVSVIFRLCPLIYINEYGSINIWFGKKASVMAGYSDDLKTFYVHFCDLTQLKK